MDALHRKITLPEEGEFFLFNAQDGKTYWVWDFGQPPLGEEMHLTYSERDR